MRFIKTAILTLATFSTLPIFAVEIDPETEKKYFKYPHNDEMNAKSIAVGWALNDDTDVDHARLETDEEYAWQILEPKLNELHYVVFDTATKSILHTFYSGNVCVRTEEFHINRCDFEFQLDEKKKLAFFTSQGRWHSRDLYAFYFVKSGGAKAQVHHSGNLVDLASNDLRWELDAAFGAKANYLRDRLSLAEFYTHKTLILQPGKLFHKLVLTTEFDVDVPKGPEEDSFSANGILKYEIRFRKGLHEFLPAKITSIQVKAGG
jgi:hypothetical protein